MRKIYLDTCSIQRPLDSKTHTRIVLEAEAVLGILSLCEANIIQLVASDIVSFELGHIPNPHRKAYAQELLGYASLTVSLTEVIENRAISFHTVGIKPLDALHLACAEAVPVDYFCTCDDKLLRKAKALTDLNITVMSPIELITELER